MFYINLAEKLSIIFKGSYNPDITDLNDLSNLSLYFLLDHNIIKHSLSSDLPRLTKEEKKQIRDLWSPYFVHMPLAPFRFYKAQTGHVDPDFVPEDLMLMHIDRFFSDRVQAKTDDNKCLYSGFFPNTNMPHTYAVNIAGKWYDCDHTPISISDLLGILPKNEEVVVKYATHSEQGRGVWFINSAEITAPYLEDLSGRINDIIIQSVIKQHPLIASMQPASVNCLRVYSLYLDGEVHICLAVLKIGSGKSRTDNVHIGGYLLALDEEGRIRDYIVNCHSEHITDIPAPIASCIGQRIPGYDRALELVREAHTHVPRYGFIGWDIAIDENSEPVLIEPNFSLSGVFEPQLCNGPMFGDMTQDILRRVFPKRRFTPLFTHVTEYQS